MATKDYMLSTVDNPYNPFTEFEQWYEVDRELGHHTLALLARVTRTSDELSELDQSQAIDQGIATILAEDFAEIYIKVAEPSADTTE